VSAIETRTSIGAPGIKRVVPIEEEPLGESTAFIQHVRPCVRSADHETMAHALLHAELERVVIRDSFGFPEVGIRVVADERHT
jgi:hypothetical protein